MIASLADIATALDADYSGSDIICRQVSIDSRHIAPDTLFVALKGSNHDGHDFIAQCQQQGAVAAIVSQPVDCAIPTIMVKDTRLALGQLAAWWREQQQLELIAITGSCGKTTTKNLMVSILQQCRQVHATRGTLNNDYGVPLTLLQLTQQHDTAVIEMGANHVGEIAYLTQLAKPQVAMITCVAPVHLEGFGSIENIAKGKAEIFQGLDEQGIAIVNRDDAFYAYWQKLLTDKKIICFGLSKQADIYATDIQSDRLDKIMFTLHFPSISLPVALPLLGDHNVLNALAAAAACYALGIDPDTIQQGLQAAEPESKRLVKQTGQSGCVVIDDSYNANPSSFAAALQVLSKQKGEKILVMGDMAELGEDAKHYHCEVAKQAKASGVTALYTLGDFGQYAAEAFGQNAFHFVDQVQLIKQLKHDVKSHHCVLVKGSRCMQMEKAVAALLE